MIRLTVSGLLAALLVVAAAPPGHAAPVVKVGNGKAASCTEAALQKALAVVEGQGGGTVVFRCGSRPVIITLLEPVIIPDETTINGEQAITLEAAPVNGGFQQSTITVEHDSSVVLTGLGLHLGFNVVVNAGTLLIHNSLVSGSISHNVLNTGTLTVVNSTFCCETFDNQGGGIFNTGRLLVQGSTFTNSLGGGIYNGGSAVINGTTFSKNQFQGGPGGAIENDGTLAISTSTFNGNLAASAGGAIVNRGMLTMYNSTVSGNQASLGGGIHNSGTLFVYLGTITGNRARSTGGGVYTCCGGTTILLRTTVTGNSPNDIVEVAP